MTTCTTENLTPMQTRILEEYGIQHIDGIVTEPCGRCDGSGHYAFNLLDGTVCFRCRGSKVQHTKLKTVLSRIRRREIATDRRNAELAAEEGVQIGFELSDLYAAAKRHKARLVAAEVAGMVHFGVVGEKLNVELRFDGVSTFENRWGWTNVYRFIDPATGSSLVWFTGTVQSINETDDAGKLFRVSATVKAHGDYEGKPQTKLIRCKFTELKK